MPRLPSYSLGLAIPLAVVALLVACGGDDDDAGPTAPGLSSTSVTSHADELTGEITVFAAASLTEAFNKVGGAFQKTHPETKLTFSFAASSALATQINEGAPADVFASADQAQMKVVTDKGSASGPRLFAKNLPAVVVPKGSDTVSTFADLAKPGLRLVLAAPDVPIGRYSRDILTKASTMPGGVSADFSTKVLENLVSNEPNVRSVLTKVQLGEADAGIVYATDVPAAQGEATGIDIPTQYNVVAEYPIAVLSASENKEVAEAFIAFILSDEGQAVMEEFGFSAP